MVDYRGIKWIEQHKRWQSSVKHTVHYSCGMHLDQKSAVMARDTKIIEKDYQQNSKF
jgi:hypothetical protein